MTPKCDGSSLPKPLTVEVRPPWPYKLPRGSGGDGTAAIRAGVLCRLLHVEQRPVLVRAWQPQRRRVILRADALERSQVVSPQLAGAPDAADPAAREHLELAIERMRFALGVDDDLTNFRASIRGDRLLEPLIRRFPDLRPRRRPWPWEALAWAVTSQLIESPRAAAIQRRIVRRWGPRIGSGRAALGDVPCAEVIAGRAPAELQSTDLSAGRAVALRGVARVAASGRCALEDPACDCRLQRVAGIGPWTVQCLGLYGRGDPDSLPAGDLGYLKLVGHLAGEGRRATVEEVERFYARYEPFRGLAGELSLRGLHGQVAKGPPLRLAA
ncbi:MAG: DNA-3-methyladenine glycosylase family protein [Solirubrobacterales bacterium]